MTTISLEEAQARLPELIDGLARGEQVLIVRGDKVVACLSGKTDEPRQPRKPGFAKGMISIVADDEDHLRDFAEYMP